MKKTAKKTSKVVVKKSARATGSRRPATTPAADGPRYITAALWPMAVAIDTIKGDPRNARRHGRASIEAIKSSLARLGQQVPIVISKSGVVLRGNGVLAAAKALGWHVLAAVRTDLGDAAARAYALADNHTAEASDWNIDTLAGELEMLAGMPDVDLLAATGFDGGDLEKLLDQLASRTPADGGQEGTAGRAPETGCEVIVECRNASHQVEIFQRLTADGLTCRIAAAKKKKSSSRSPVAGSR